MGDPVLLSYAFCDTCSTCKGGHHSHCPEFVALNFAGQYPIFKSKDGTDISGCFFGQSSFANLSIVKSCSVVNVKDIVHDKEELRLFSPLGCGIQTGSGSVVNAGKAGPDDVILVMGLGGVGLSAIMTAKIQGCRMIIGLDRVESRLALAKELGATHTINGGTLGDKSLVDAVREVAEGQGPTVVIETTGAPPLVNAAIQFTRSCGRIVQVGTTPFDFQPALCAFDFMVAGKQYIGAVEGQVYPPKYVPKMIEWYREGRFPIDRLVKMMKPEEFKQSLKEMHDGTTVKPIICWS